MLAREVGDATTERKLKAFAEKVRACRGPHQAENFIFTLPEIDLLGLSAWATKKILGVSK